MRTLKILFIVTVLGGFGILILIATLQNEPEAATAQNAARSILNDPNAKVTEGEEITVIFQFRSHNFARADALKMYPELACRLRDGFGMMGKPYRFVGTVIIDGQLQAGVNLYLTADEVAGFDCQAGGAINLDVNPLLP